MNDKELWEQSQKDLDRQLRLAKMRLKIALASLVAKIALGVFMFPPLFVYCWRWWLQ